MQEYDDYDLKYPTLIMEILEYFMIRNGINERSIIQFCEMNGKMSMLRNDGGTGICNNYMVAIPDEAYWNSNRERLQVYYNSLVYGFEYIYNLYKEIVIPLVWEKQNGDYSAGTGFKLYGGIVTAKHCITDPKNLSIKGYSAEKLVQSTIYVSENSNLDIAFIDVGEKETTNVFTADGKVLQDVLALGYPKIPAFTDFLTAEKATISSKATSRLTPTKGAIAAFGNNYLARTELMLITAKIRGGNSGGPVINEEGSVVGVSCQMPNYEGDIGEYDDLGYGIVVPIKYLNEIVREKKETLTVPSDFYRDFIE